MAQHGGPFFMLWLFFLSLIFLIDWNIKVSHESGAIPNIVWEQQYVL